MPSLPALIPQRRATRDSAHNQGQHNRVGHADISALRDWVEKPYASFPVAMKGPPVVVSGPCGQSAA